MFACVEPLAPTLAFVGPPETAQKKPAKRVSRSAGLTICSPQGMGDPHNSAPRGSQHLSCVPICARDRMPQGQPGLNLCGLAAHSVADRLVLNRRPDPVVGLNLANRCARRQAQYGSSQAIANTPPHLSHSNSVGCPDKDCRWLQPGQTT